MQSETQGSMADVRPPLGGVAVKLLHLDLPVSDVAATSTFFATYLGFAIDSEHRSAERVFLTDSHGFCLVLQTTSAGPNAFPEGFHVGFVTDEATQVRDLHARLGSAGFPVSDVATSRRGTVFYCKGPGDLLVEVSSPFRSNVG